MLMMVPSTQICYLQFGVMHDQFSIKCKPTTVRNPISNSILVRLQGVISSILQSAGLKEKRLITIEYQTVHYHAAWAVCFNHLTVLDSSPETAIFSKDMLFDLPYLSTGKIRVQEPENCWWCQQGIKCEAYKAW